MASSEPRMWSYWRDKKGVQEALEDYHGDQLKADLELRAALTQLKSAEALIDKIMTKAAEEDEYGRED